MSQKNQNKRVLVTGASSGLGRAITLSLLNDGAHVIASGRNKSKLEELNSHHNGSGKLSIEVQDLSDKDIKLDRWVQGLAKTYGKLHGTVLAAGVQHIVPLKALSEAKAEEIFNTNFFANLWLAKGFCDKRSNVGIGSSLVLISSISSIKGEAGLSIYSASKGAINSLTRSLAKEVSHQGVRVNAVLPGLVKTELLEKFSSIYNVEFLKKAEKEYPLGLGEPNDVVGPVKFLLSDDAKWITGICLTIDGGATL